MEIRLFGGGGRMKACEAILKERARDMRGELLLLPIPTTRDKKYITDTDTALSEISALVGCDTVVAGYAMPDAMRRDIIASGGRVLDAALDENFLAENAEVTARGALGYILTHSERDISSLNIGVVGYGRIGMRLSRLLLYLGAKIKVYTTRESLVSELCECGISAEYIVEGGRLEGIDILINTAPAKLFSDSEITEFLRRGSVIDLASGRYFDGILGVVKLGSIPAAYYPYTAGELYADFILRELGGVSR